MEVEKNGMLSFLGTKLLNLASRVESKVYVNPTNTCLLLQYKRSLLTAMLDRAHYYLLPKRISLKTVIDLQEVFSRLKYQERLIIFHH